MTKIGKVLAVFVAVASLAFVGFAIATTFGGPDWQTVVQADYFKAYRIERSPGADALWIAVRGRDEEQVASSRVLPEVLTRVMDEVEQNRQERIRSLKEREPLLEERIAALDAAREADEEALKNYEAAQRKRLAEARQQEAETASRVVAATEESQKLEDQIEARREDVFRLRQEVEELRADQFRLEEIQAQLRDLLNQIEGNLLRAEQREALLKGD
jgi:chromosome segregation ATPase